MASGRELGMYWIPGASGSGRWLDNSAAWPPPGLGADKLRPAAPEAGLPPQRQFPSPLAWMGHRLSPSFVLR